MSQYAHEDKKEDLNDIDTVDCLKTLTEKVHLVSVTDIVDLKRWVDLEMETQIIENNIALLEIDSITSSLLFLFALPFYDQL